MNQFVSTFTPIAKRDQLNIIPYPSLRNLTPIPETPSVFTLELTTLCNNSCSGCANLEVPQAKKNKAYQTMTNWKKIIAAIKPYAKLIRISGGEPTLHKDFFQIVRFLEENQIPHALLTTGRWGKAKTDKLIALYKQCEYFVGLLISLHGSNARTHNAFVESSPKAFAETCRNIYKASKAGLRVFTNTVLTRYACREVLDIIELSSSLGAQYQLFNRFLTNDHPLEPGKELLFDTLQKIERLHLKGFSCRVGNNVPLCFAQSSSEGGKAGFELCHISPSGEIRPDNLTRLSFGNLLEDRLRNIWDSPASRLYRISFPPDCLQCKAFHLCRGGAKSLTFQYGLERDKLMRSPIQKFYPSKSSSLKNTLAYLALTSD